MKILKELKYSKDHEWVKVEGGIAIVGITDFAQNQLGDVVFVDLPSLGLDVSKGDGFGAIESVKAVSDLYSPVSGRIFEVNDDLADAPESVNEDPYEKAWMIKIQITDPSELDNLLNSDEYKELCNKEGH